MRTKKNREVNIFSASVVDLFASGLGVFLIVSIIALVNQKKENAVSGSSAKGGKSAAANVEELEAKIKKLSDKLKKKQEENIILRAKGTEASNKALEDKLKFEARLEKTQLENQYEKIIQDQKEKIKELKDQYDSVQSKVGKLSKNINDLKGMYKEISKGTQSSKSMSVSNLKVGSKIQLNNVQFYAGTAKTIEPYASDEIHALGKLLIENLKIKVEVSGHIYLSKDELEKGEKYDASNLSQKRADTVCKRLLLMGVDESRLKCIGYGGTRYLYLTNDEYSREAQLNRRVEVEVLDM